MPEKDPRVWLPIVNRQHESPPWALLGVKPALDLTRHSFRHVSTTSCNLSSMTSVLGPLT